MRFEDGRCSLSVGRVVSGGSRTPQGVRQHLTNPSRGSSTSFVLSNRANRSRFANPLRGSSKLTNPSWGSRTSKFLPGEMPLARLPPGQSRPLANYLLVSQSRYAKKFGFPLKTFGSSLKPFRRSLKSSCALNMVWPIARPRRGGDGEGPPGPPRPKGNPQQPPHGIAHFEGEPSSSCVNRDDAAISPGLRVSLFRGAVTQRCVARSSCGVSARGPRRRRGPKTRPLLRRSRWRTPMGGFGWSGPVGDVLSVPQARTQCPPPYKRPGGQMTGCPAEVCFSRRRGGLKSDNRSS